MFNQLGLLFVLAFCLTSAALAQEQPSHPALDDTPVAIPILTMPPPNTETLQERLARQEPSDQNVFVTVVPEKSVSSCNGLVSVVLTIVNSSSERLLMPLGYPLPLEFEFWPMNKSAKIVVKHIRYPSWISPIKAINPGTTYRSIIYLNRYLTFTSPGDFDLGFRFSVRGHYFLGGSDDSPENGSVRSRFGLKLAGVLHFNLRKRTNAELDKELETVSNGLLHPYTLACQEAEEGMRYANPTLAAKHWAKALSYQGGNRDISEYALYALIQINTPEAIHLIKTALPSHDVFFNKRALDCFAENGVAVEDKILLPLLKSDNESIQIDAIWYLAQMGTKQQLPLLRPLLHGQSQFVTEEAWKAMTAILAKKPNGKGKT